MLLWVVHMVSEYITHVPPSADLPRLLADLAVTGSISRTAANLGASAHGVRDSLYLGNNLAADPLFRFTANGSGDGVVLTDSGHACVATELQTLFRAFLQEPAVWRRPFTAFRYRRELLDRLALRSGVRNHLHGRIRALHPKGTSVVVAVDIGGGRQLAAVTTLAHGRQLDLAVDMECSLLIRPGDVSLPACVSAGRFGGNRLACTVLPHQAGTPGEIALGLGDGKRLIAAMTDTQVRNVRMQPGTIVQAWIPAARISLVVDAEPMPYDYDDVAVPSAATAVDVPLIPALRGSPVQASTFTYDSLMRHAHKPDDFVTRALAGAIASAAAGLIEAPNIALGLSRPRFAELLAQHFPGMEARVCTCGEACGEGCRPLRADEFQDLVELLLAHRSDDSEATEWLAYAIASACMGGNHLYQDIGLPDRQALSDLLQRHFTRLFAKNAGNMKWKKFFYKQLCDQAQVNVCQAPSCQVCNDYWNCFGPEDDSFPVNLAALAGRPAGGD